MHQSAETRVLNTLCSARPRTGRRSELAPGPLQLCACALVLWLSFDTAAAESPYWQI